MKRGMIDLGFLSYYEDEGEGEVYLDAEFFNLDETMQLDILSDWIHLLASIQEAVNKYGEHND